MPRKTIKFSANGEIAIRQTTINGFEISYNPDDDRWYVLHIATDENRTTYAGNRKGFYNATQYAKKH